MKKLARNIFICLIIFWVIAYLCFFIQSHLNAPGRDEVHEAFHWDWIFASTFMNFIQYFIPVSCSAILLSFSFLCIPRTSVQPSSLPFSRNVTTTIILLVAVLCIFIFIRETRLPQIHRSLNNMSYLSGIVKAAKGRAEEAFKEKDYESALEFTDIFLKIVENDTDMIKLREKIVVQIQSGGSDREEDSLTNEDETAKTGAFLEKAQYYFRTRDYYSAHYYANQALTIDPGRVDIRNIASRSWQMIEDLPLNATTIEEAGFHDRKRRGYLALQEKRYLDAYYIFFDLMQDRPGKDPDIQKYFREASEKIKDYTYFLDEKEEASVIPGIQDVFFRNPESKRMAESEKNKTQFVYFRKYAVTDKGHYVFDTEIIQLSESGSVDYHVYAPFAKIIDTEKGQALLLKGVSRENSRVFIIPTYYTDNESKNLPATLLSINVNKDALPICSTNADIAKTEYINTLWNMRKLYSDLGYSQHTISMEIITRLMIPFTFLIFAFFSMSLGWALHVKTQERKAYMYLVFPVVPFLFFLLQEIYNTSASVLYLFILIKTGLVLTMISCAAVSFFLMVLSLLLLALQRPRT